jgi:hypothetical protein
VQLIEKRVTDAEKQKAKQNSVDIYAIAKNIEHTMRQAE